MQYFLYNKCILFAETSGHLNCFPTPSIFFSDSFTDQFVKTDNYSHLITAIKKVIPTNEEGTNNVLYLNSNFYTHPGLLQALNTTFKNDVQIKSGLDFIINSRNLNSGNYSLIDIGEFETNLYQFSVWEKEYQITSKTKIENSNLIHAFSKALKIDSSKEKILNNLFSYQNSIAVNEYLQGVPLAHLQYYHFDDDEMITDLKELPCERLDTFFEIIVEEIISFIRGFVPSMNNLFIKSSLLNYFPIKAFINHFQNAILINELELLNNSLTLPIKKSIRTKATYDLMSFPESTRVELPFSSWILSDIENLKIELVKNIDGKKQSIPINSDGLKEIFQKNSFSLNKKHLVKYLAEFNEDCCNNLHLKIKTMENEEFYQSINN